MSITKADLDFDNGVNLIIGNNGAGKSSALLAVAMCLNEDKKGESYKDYIQNNFDHAYVYLSATIKGKPIEFNVTLNNKGGTPFERVVKYDSKEYKNSEVSDLLESFDIKYFSNIIMSMQGEDDITKLKPAERERYLQKLLNFDFTEQIKSIDETLAECKDNISYNRGSIEANKTAIETNKASIKQVAEVNFTEKDIKDTEKEIKAKEEAFTQVTKNIEAIKRLSDEKNSLEYKYNLKDRDILSIQSKIKELENSKNEKSKLESELIELETLYKTKSDEKSIAEVNKANIKHEIDTLKDKQSNINSKLAEAKVSLSVANKKVELMNDGKCPTCGHDFSSDEKDTAISERDAIKKEYDSLSNNASDIVLDIRKRASDFRTADDALTSINKEILKIEYDINFIKKSISAISEVDADISRYTEKLKIEEDELNSIKNSLTKINDSIAASPKVEDISVLNSELSELRSKLSKYNEVIMQNNIILMNNKKLEDSIKDLEAKNESIIKDIDTAIKKESVYNEAKQVFSKNLPNYLVVKTCAKLEKEMNDFIHIIFPDMEVRLYQNKRGVEFFYTPSKLTVKTLDKDNLINVKMASGFEKAVLSIAFKVSLCKAYGLDFAFFDEIDSAGTEENSEKMFRSLIGNGVFSQVFIITHKPAVRDVITSIAPKVQTYYVKSGAFSVEEN